MQPGPRVAVLLRLIDQAYDKKSWHGTNLRGSLRGLSAEDAAWRPAVGRHNIWELAVHAAYWKYSVLRRLRGGERGGFPVKGSNWFRRPEDGPDEGLEGGPRPARPHAPRAARGSRGPVGRGPRSDPSRQQDPARRSHLRRGVPRHLSCRADSGAEEDEELKPLLAILLLGLATSEPTVFAPGVISTGEYESHAAFSPDGKTIYFLKNTADFNHWTIVSSHLRNGSWTPPEVVPFSGRYSDADPFVTAHGLETRT